MKCDSTIQTKSLKFKTFSFLEGPLVEARVRVRLCTGVPVSMIHTQEFKDGREGTSGTTLKIWCNLRLKKHSRIYQQFNKAKRSYEDLLSQSPIAKSSITQRTCVTSPYDQRKFWKMWKNSFKNGVAQEREFTKYHPAKSIKEQKKGGPVKRKNVTAYENTCMVTN